MAATWNVELDICTATAFRCAHQYFDGILLQRHSVNIIISNSRASENKYYILLKLGKDKTYSISRWCHMYGHLHYFSLYWTTFVYYLGSLFFGCANNVSQLFYSPTIIYLFVYLRKRLKTFHSNWYPHNAPSPFGFDSNPHNAHDIFSLQKKKNIYKKPSTKMHSLPKQTILSPQGDEFTDWMASVHWGKNAINYWELPHWINNRAENKQLHSELWCAVFPLMCMQCAHS